MSDPTENETLRDEIARRAYTKFCDRGCVHGDDVDDWLAAEREVLAEQEKPAETPKSTAEDRPRRRNGKGRR
jgi:Protein of unknown function (DUF2934)